MNMPAADDHNTTPQRTGRPPVLYILGGVAALIAILAILHLTGVVG